MPWPGGLLSAGWDGHLVWLDGELREQRRKTFDSPILSVAEHATGLVIVTADGQVQTLVGDEVQSIVNLGECVSAAVGSTHVAVGALPGTVTTAPLDGSSAPVAEPRHAAMVVALSWGHACYSVGLDGGLRRPGTDVVAVGGRVRALAIRGDQQVVLGMHDGTLVLWHDGTPKAMKGHAGAVRCLAVEPTTGRLCSGGQDRAVLTWAVSDLEADA
jgi:hypothetical protein